MNLETKNWYWLEQVLNKSDLDYRENYFKAKQHEVLKGSLSHDQVHQKCMTYCADPQRYIHLPQMMPGSERVKQLYERMSDPYSLIESPIDNFQAEYINEETSDPHVMKSLLSFVQILQDQGRDPYDQTTFVGAFGEFLIVVDTGSGQELSWFLKNIPHKYLVLPVPSINHISSSFKEIDWGDIWNAYCQDSNKSISLIVFDENNDTSEGLVGSLSNQSLTGLDHSFVFYPDNPDDQVKKFLEKSLSIQRLHMPVNYLGFTMDEYNMLWHSWHSLLKRPKVFAAPSKKLDLPAVVVGSGPSLDQDIEKIKQLSKTHMIIAAASSSYSLLKNEIEPDFLILLERGTHEVENYTKLKSDFPDTKMKLVACVSCASDLHELFGESAIYFRPGSTPSTLFSPSPLNIIDYEGPQTVNTAVSFALRITSGDLVLMGIDLGTTSLDNPRSKDAVGISPRDFDLVEEGNFTAQIYTERELLDGATAMGDCIRSVGKNLVKVYNSSDGIRIKNAISKRIDQYIDDFEAPAKKDDKINILNSFWSNLGYYDNEDMMMRWNSAEPRRQILNVSKQLEEIFKQDADSWFLNSGNQLVSCLSATNFFRKQFVARLYRGAIIKSSLAMKRTMNVLHKDKEAQKDFYQKASAYMLNLVSSMRTEVFQVCDILESHYHANAAKN